MEAKPLSASIPTPDRASGGKIYRSVLADLGARILGGTYQPGDVLPREDELAATLGVSRSSLREAIKVLCAKGLLESRQRIGATVRPRTEWHLLDAAVLSWHPDITRDRELISGLVEARRIIEPAAAELAARRARAAELAVIENAYLAMAAAIPDDLKACCEADIAFHKAIIAASGNIVLKGLVGTIEAALRAVFLITNQLMSAQSKALASHAEVMDEIRLRNGAKAREAMDRLLDVAVEDLGHVGSPVPAGRPAAPPEREGDATC
jgi:DNA-binding FadR family transcriptional regulator